ncbi:hypothetical protein J1N35_028623 [Gossypium stocksii]|uniref:Uncharacterized protein n=1 Tax=Gossypium stocksii TaxID=47602 RepID=A0A9D3ZRA8_9ROSI|nr:hypothetical protein J1N35_028623 [Gossypium stocksii]
MIGEVKNHEEWEKIEQFETASEFGKRPEMMDRNVGFSEVVLEAKKTERLDKWSLMGRLGNKARSLITQCAARMRPDIIHVKKPVYQCRYEGQGSCKIVKVNQKAFVDDVVKGLEKLSEEGKPRCLGLLILLCLFCILIQRNGRLSWRRWNSVVMPQMTMRMLVDIESRVRCSSQIGLRMMTMMRRKQSSSSSRPRG